MLAAAQTPASLEVLINSLDFSKKEGTGDIERALTGIAFSSHPSELTVTTLTVSVWYSICILQKPKPVMSVFHSSVPPYRPSISIVSGSFWITCCR